MIRLYLDEDSQDRSLLRALRARNIDAIAVQETQTEGLEGLIDVEQLRLATKQRRVLYSHNIGDFYQLHTEFIASGEKHSRIALLAQNYSVGEQVRAILEFISNKTAEEMESQLEFLSKYLRS